MDIYEKLEILSDAAKYDVACTSSGVDRNSPKDGIGSAVKYGICHSFAGDGRCISLLKILLSNVCAYDCKYCINRKSNDVRRATFTPKEIADLTINFYRRNYIEGLFLSSAVIGTTNHTAELMYESLRILREEYKFYGYIHVKAIPGADPLLIEKIGLLTDRMSINIEMPSEKSLVQLAPDKTKDSILKPMGQITNKIIQSKKEVAVFNSAPKFVPAGQSTQMIIGASPETDYSILKLTEGLYKKYSLKRVFFSAYIATNENSLLPSIDTKPPLLRENRLYQADWLLRYYNFKADEILDEKNQSFNPYLDPKCNWAVNNPQFFPVEINKASYNDLLRVPGIGVRSVNKIVKARKINALSFLDLKRLGVVLKRAQYFITCNGKANEFVKINPDNVINSLLSKTAVERLNESGYNQKSIQLSMFETSQVSNDDKIKTLVGEM